MSNEHSTVPDFIIAWLFLCRDHPVVALGAQLSIALAFAAAYWAGRKSR